MAPRAIPFWSKVNFGSGCWEWTGYLDEKGYGQCWSNGRSDRAHRVAFKDKNGEIPEGTEVCHKCDNRKCVRPDHLFVGTHRDNILDMFSKNRSWQSKVTHCPRNHEYSAENTHVYKGRRSCLICKKQLSRESYLRRKSNENQ